jgi:hypothetical protein
MAAWRRLADTAVRCEQVAGVNKGMNRYEHIKFISVPAIVHTCSYLFRNIYNARVHARIAYENGVNGVNRYEHVENIDVFLFIPRIRGVNGGYEQKPEK